MASLEQTPCPRCGSPQRFAPRAKAVLESFNSDVFEIYIECKLCHWSKTIDVGTKHELKLRGQMRKLRRLGEATGDERYEQAHRKRVDQIKRRRK